jgi:hypothetical protein
MLAVFFCEIERTEGFSGCVRLLGREREQEEVAGVPNVVGIELRRPSVSATPTSDLFGLEASRVEMRKRKEGGGPWDL